MKKNTMRKILALALVLAMAAGCVFSAFAETVTATVYIFSMSDEEIERKVDGDVAVEDMHGVDVTAKNTSTAEVEVTGNVTSEGDGATAVVAYARDDAETTVTVGGEVEAISTQTDEDADGGRARGVEVNASRNGEVTVITGDVTTEGLSYNAVQIITYDDGEANVTTGDIDASGDGLRIEVSGGSAAADTGDIRAEGNGVSILTSDSDAEAGATAGDIDAGSNGVLVDNQGGTAEVTTGNIEAAESGVSVWYDADWEQVGLTKDEFDALNLDPADADEFFMYVDSEDTTHYTRNWRDSEGVNYNVMGYYSDESTFVEEDHWKNAPVYHSGDTTVTVNGGITVESTEGYAAGLEVIPNPNIPDTSLNVTVNGDVNVTAANPDGYTFAQGVGVYDVSNGADYQVEISGDLNVSSENYAYVHGITANVNDADVKINVGGALSVTLEDGQESMINGIEARADGGGSLSVTIGKGVEVISDTVDDVYAEGISVSTGADGDNKIVIDVLDGGVTVENDSATAVRVSNASGEVDVTIAGDVISAQTGISLGASGEAESDTSVTVDGDVKAGDVGVSLTLRNEKAAMDLIVDGTVSGEISSVMVAEGTIAENVTLTVWEVKPNEDGSVAQKQSWTFDEETGRQMRVFTEDEAFEKQIQYIIRVEQPEVGSVTTDGTSEYKGYDVAHEGDTVTLKVSVPEGYRLADAFNGTDTKVQLLKDANGNFYLVVPRGGAVTLSVKLEAVEAPAEEESPAEEEAPAGEDTPAAVVTPEETAPEAEPETEPEAEPEKMDDAQISAAVEELLTKNGVLENSVVEVETDDSGAKTVVISPETLEAGEESTVLRLTVPAEMLTRLADSDVQQIRMVSQSGGAAVSLDLAAAVAAAADKQGAKLVISIEENSESITNALQAVPAGFTGRAGAVTVTARIEDAEGNVTVLDSGANITLTLNIEYEEGMKILFIDADGNVSETEAVWAEGADGEPGCWKVPFLGEGTYLPVIADQ